MVEAISYNDLLEELRNRYKENGTVTVGLLLGNANCNFMKSNILNKINQFHHRSNHNVDFYFPGYGAYWHGCFGEEETVSTVGGVKWLFSDKLYCEFIEELESHSKWRYSGETELILLSFKNGELDFSEMLVFWLDKMVSDQVIYSPSNFFETVFRLFKDNNSVYGASDMLAFKGISESIYELIKQKIPFSELLNNKWYCIKDYSL